MNLPLTYRDPQVTTIFHAIQAGDSGQIIGMGSVGKSNLLRFLQEPEVHQARFGQAAAGLLIVYVDTNKLLKPSHWGLLELMLHQIIAAMEQRGAPGELIDRLADLHTHACLPTSRDLALRYLDRALGLVYASGVTHVVFLLDEFDALYYRLPGKSFAALRALRDDYKRRLCYWVAMRRPPGVDQPEPAYREAFAELISDHVIWLGAYNEADAQDMLDNLCRRNQATLSPEAKRQALAITGGHGGLLRAVFPFLTDQPPSIAHLLEQPSVVEECLRLWLSLVPNDQNLLIYLAAQPARGKAAAPPTNSTDLSRKGLLVGGTDHQPAEIFSPLFAVYLRAASLQAGRRIYLNGPRRLAIVDGREISNISGLEWKLLEYLVEHYGEVCTHEALYRQLYPDEPGQELKGQRLYKVVQRLNKLIEPDRQNFSIIENLRGAGYQISH